MDYKGEDEETYEDEVDSQRFLHTESEGKLYGSKQHGVQTRLQDLPTILCRTSTLSPEGKKDIGLITPSSQLVQPLADLQNSLTQLFKR